MQVPLDVGLDGVEPHGGNLREAVTPQSPGNAKVVDGPGDVAEGSAVLQKCVALVVDCERSSIVVQEYDMVVRNSIF